MTYLRKRNVRTDNLTFVEVPIVDVPQYGVEPDIDARAVFQELLPDWRIVGINAAGLIGKAGSLHCISINVPSGVPIPAGDELHEPRRP